MAYYIFKFAENEAGAKLAFQLSGVPNGTVFEADSLYVNSRKNLWIIFPRSNDLDSINSSINYILKTGGAEIIETNITDRIVVPYGVTRNNNDHITKEFNQYLFSLFKNYVSESDFY